MESLYLECLRWVYALTPDDVGVACGAVILASLTAGVVFCTIGAVCEVWRA